jgi:hypothetical protein
VLDVALEQRRHRGVALEGAAVEGEEEPLEPGELRVGDVGPHPPDDLVGPLAGDGSDGGQLLLGARLDGSGHLEQQAVLGPEVVQQHAVARADGLGDPAQALVRQPLGAEVLDHRVEQPLLSRHPAVDLEVHVPNGTFDRGTKGGTAWPNR